MSTTRTHNWYFTLLNDPETAIEYVVVCLDEDFDRYVRSMRQSWNALHKEFGSRPEVRIPFPGTVMAKHITESPLEDIEASIDAAKGWWAKLNLAPIHDLLFEAGVLKKEAVMELLREGQVDGSAAWLCMTEPNRVFLTVDPGDSDNTSMFAIDADFLPDNTI